MTRTTVDALVIEVSGLGVSGFGESTDNSYYDSVISKHVNSLSNIELPILSSVLHPATFYDNVLKPMELHSFLLSAIDCAYWDWYGKVHAISAIDLMPWKWLDQDIPQTSYTIGLDQPDQMIQSISEKPWPIYKIKINQNNPLKLLRTLRKKTDAAFYVDANASLNSNQFEELLGHAQELRIHILEQPFEKKSSQRILQHGIELKIAADESVMHMDDLADLKSLGYDIVNLKLMKNGGISACIPMIQFARDLGFSLMMGCMTASTVAIAPIRLFLPILDYVDMDGNMLLKDDIAYGIEYRDHRAIKPNGHGLGIQLDPLALLNKRVI
jgi:L-alanine-DL-glutamate epimerase-like enolase superfamily enzyme